MNYRYSFDTRNDHLKLLGNISSRNITYSKYLPITGTSITDKDKTSYESEIPLPLIKLYTLQSSNSYHYPINITIHIYYNLDEIYYRVDNDNYQLYSGEQITLQQPCRVDYFGIRLNELVTNVYSSVFNVRPYPTSYLFVEPSSGTYTSLRNIIITVMYDNNSTVYYTNNGLDPDINSNIYITPFTPDSFGIYRFISINNDNNNIRSNIINRYYSTITSFGIGRGMIGSTFKIKYIPGIGLAKIGNTLEII